VRLSAARIPPWRSTMRAHEKATRAHLRDLGVDLAKSPLARLALDLAQRLDADPTDRDMTALSREQRLVWASLEHQTAGGSELDGFLKGISSPSFGDGSH
jgi:hypothetical protein